MLHTQASLQAEHRRGDVSAGVCTVTVRVLARHSLQSDADQPACIAELKSLVLSWKDIHPVTFGSLPRTAMLYWSIDGHCYAAMHSGCTAKVCTLLWSRGGAGRIPGDGTKLRVICSCDMCRCSMYTFSCTSLCRPPALSTIKSGSCSCPTLQAMTIIIYRCSSRWLGTYLACPNLVLKANAH